jgi:hypothetical protein
MCRGVGGLGRDFKSSSRPKRWKGGAPPWEKGPNRIVFFFVFFFPIVFFKGISDSYTSPQSIFKRFRVKGVCQPKHATAPDTVVTVDTPSKPRSVSAAVLSRVD